MLRVEFGRYQLLERLAVGGTAEVYRATAADGSTVVLKKVLPQHAEDPRFARLFAREARIAASLQHPNIVSLRDFGEIDGTLYLALEHVDGADLSALLRRCQLGAAGAVGLPPPALCAHLTREVALALAYVHQRTDQNGAPLSIVHRDVSPQNILVARDGSVKLTDFGIARSALNDQTTGAVIRGKLAYMAPEQAVTGATLDARTDVFGLGAVLYHMVLGRPPFVGANEAETLRRVQQGEMLLDVDALSPGARALAPVIQRCLARLPEQRYASAEELAGSLASHCDPETGPDALARWAAAAGFEAPRRAIDQRARALLGGQADERHDTAMIAASRDTGEGQEPVSSSLPVSLSVPLSPSRHLLRWSVLGLAALGAVALPLVLWRGGGDRPATRLAVDQGAPGPAAVRTRPADAQAGEPRTARMAIISRPAEATVHLDGRPLGRTPLVLDAPRPPFSLSLERPGYQRWARVLDALPGGGRLEVTLKPQAQHPAQGALTVNSVPWAKVFLDGRFIGNTPIHARKLPAGEHRVVLEDQFGRVLRSFVSRIEAGHTSVHSFLGGEP